jgi:hypothetical protein
MNRNDIPSLVVQNSNLNLPARRPAFVETRTNFIVSTMATLYEVASFVLVGALWGCTNPLLKAGSEAAPPASAPGSSANGRGQLAAFFAEIGALLANWKFVLPFLLNQCGSVAYVATLGSSAISLAMPICNSLALLFNCITSRLLGERALDPRTCRIRSRINENCPLFN